MCTQNRFRFRPRELQGVREENKMDLRGVRSIRIAVDDFLNVIAGKTNNPLAEAEINKVLRDVIKSSIPVIITDHTGGQSRQLKLDSNGKFAFA